MSMASASHAPRCIILVCLMISSPAGAEACKVFRQVRPHQVSLSVVDFGTLHQQSRGFLQATQPHKSSDLCL
eukprot:2380018-Karenia_brevis.AAC.1